jgi:hypothetical protein
MVVAECAPLFRPTLAGVSAAEARTAINDVVNVTTIIFMIKNTRPLRLINIALPIGEEKTIL